MRVVFFGTPQFAVPTLRAAARLARTTSSASSPSPIARAAAARRSPTRRSRRWPSSTDCRCFSRTRLRDPEVAETLRALGTRPRAWSPPTARSFPRALLDLPRLGMINVHASLLPKYRGAAPVHRAVIDGDAETGVTIMRVVHGARRRRHVRQGDATDRPDETSDVVERDLADLGASLLVEVVDRSRRRHRASRNRRTTRCRPTRRSSRRKKG